MRAVVCQELGPPESLVVLDLPSPELPPDHVRVGVRAAGVNFLDTLIIQGQYQVRPDLPFTPGAEAAGVVLEVGADVPAGLTVGQRVVAMMSFGAFAEEVVVHWAAVHAIPDAMGDATAAALLLQYGTSAHALLQRAPVTPGDWLVVHGASGGVGLAAVEIGRALGARVIGTGGDPKKLEAATERGAELVLSYREGGVKDAVREATGGQGANIVYDAVGGDMFDESLRYLAWDGKLLVVGFAAGRIPSAPANLLLLKGSSVVGVFFGAFAMRDPELNRANIQRVIGWWADGVLRPSISHRFPLERAGEAIQALADRHVIGKAVVEV